uniref:Uncharacterized protein n=1 Tax=Candidatus Kentrum sp. TC TaxID=2126339 RepID=A0A450Z3B0_9GAMM|nr:MAG: hypothetical protein BECKTC1821E_GA0114239_11064 [Candidatus Kentron sp. TC]
MVATKVHPVLYKDTMKDHYRLSHQFLDSREEKIMAITVLQDKDYSSKVILYMAKNPNDTTWKLGFSNGSRGRIVREKR